MLEVIIWKMATNCNQCCSGFRSIEKVTNCSRRIGSDPFHIVFCSADNIILQHDYNNAGERLSFTGSEFLKKKT
jgi:hypothetical protein